LPVDPLGELGVTLAGIDWRLLHWLLRYPLQRVDDLVVGVARWASRATVYRHVQALQTRGLVESVLPKTPGAGKRLYHLSNFGLHLLARHLDRPARALARRWQADEVGLLHVLPRLPTLLVLQEVVNSLVTHAAEAMTTNGRRPLLVRWNWQRDVNHRFLYRERCIRFFVDGMLALCIRIQQNDGSILDQWFGLFLLSTELDDERLMRLRLKRLLCWRESPERWSSYRHMLPVLILARSHRQRAHWQRAVEASALRLRLDPLAGALVCLPPDENAQVNPWVLNWHTLATDVSCHLQGLLRSLPREAFPSSLWLEEGQVEEPNGQSPLCALAVKASSGMPARFSRLLVGDLANRVTHVTQDGLEEHQVIALLGLRLTPCQWNILRLLLEHPLLSDDELAVFLGILRRSVRCSLYELHQLGCLEPISTKVGQRWRLDGRGLRLIAAAHHLHIRNIAEIRDEKTDGGTSITRQRGEAWLLQHIQHTAGIYGFFASLAQAARKEAGHELCWWETGATCERRYQVAEQWYNLRPDALAAYGSGQQQIRFWLEWDRGTMNVRDLGVKFSSYAYFIASREWAREFSLLPALICIAPDIAQERRLAHVVRTRLAQADGLVVWSTTEVLLNTYGPLAPIWFKTIPTLSQVEQSGNVARQIIFDLVSQHTPDDD
jgi:Replication-relaxation